MLEGILTLNICAIAEAQSSMIVTSLQNILPKGIKLWAADPHETLTLLTRPAKD